jgi:hypothetical protein
MPDKHQFSSGVADGADATLVQPSDWNALHYAPYASGAFTLPTDTGAMHVDTLTLTTTLAITLEGTSTLVVL